MSPLSSMLRCVVAAACLHQVDSTTLGSLPEHAGLVRRESALPVAKTEAAAGLAADALAPRGSRASPAALGSEQSASPHHLGTRRATSKALDALELPPEEDTAASRWKARVEEARKVLETDRQIKAAQAEAEKRVEEGEKLRREAGDNTWKSAEGGGAPSRDVKEVTLERKAEPVARGDIQVASPAMADGGASSAGSPVLTQPVMPAVPAVAAAAPAAVNPEESSAREREDRDKLEFEKWKKEQREKQEKDMADQWKKTEAQRKREEEDASMAVR
eukprot:TRINITY_DN84605_c0_g1_i1.p1 TRINITY_DN84605_c0_g1~~TRINITY_DN84605_c0_g1_i1.p1  ORF type:complete len:303 (-),score=95.42 TRINITY_DN84605_c0_g1_i1:90-914(-)